MRVLLGTDGSPDAVRTADWLAGFPLPAESQMHAQARQVLEDARLTLAPRAVDVQPKEGGVRDRLLQTAEEWNADLIVLGARGPQWRGAGAAWQRFP